MPGTLYVVATPIGNLEDITLRAARVLREADLIAAEDTRHSRRLLDHLGVNAPVTSYHEHNEESKSLKLVEELESGKIIALITDAGTPCVSDPGYRLVRAARMKGIPVVAIPGPSAAIAALSISGLPSDCFTFHGFFPRKRSRALDMLGEAARAGGTHLFYEAPNRLADTLAMLAEHLPGSEVAVARELTKIHEEVVLGAPSKLAARYAAAPPRGECVLLVHLNAHEAEEPPDADELRQAVEALMAEKGLSRRDAVRQIAERLGVARNTVYAAAMGERE